MSQLYVGVYTLKEQATSASFQAEEEYARAITILDGVTGINARIAQIIVAEIGIDMRHFPSEAHVASWVGLCPGTKISAGKRLSGKTEKGNRWLRQALIEAAQFIPLGHSGIAVAGARRPLVPDEGR